MSRAFVKEGAPEVPVVIPPRPPLPAGVPNYVTPTGLAALRTEKASLERRRAALDAEDPDASRERELLTGLLRQVVERIARSREVDPSALDRSDIRFGATVTVRDASGEERTVQIVGVDEAAASDDAVAFTSPYARALTGASAGDTVRLQTPSGETELTILSVRYGA